MWKEEGKKVNLFVKFSMENFIIQAKTLPLGGIFRVM